MPRPSNTGTQSTIGQVRLSNYTSRLTSAASPCAEGDENTCNITTGETTNMNTVEAIQRLYGFLSAGPERSLLHAPQKSIHRKRNARLGGRARGRRKNARLTRAFLPSHDLSDEETQLVDESSDDDAIPAETIATMVAQM